MVLQVAAVGLERRALCVQSRPVLCTVHPRCSLFALAERSGTTGGQRPAVTSVPVDYAQAVSVDRGRCFRYVDDGQGKPDRCLEAVVTSGWLKVDRWCEVDACSQHAAQLRSPRSRPSS
jgi:hypothetical protein